MKAHCPPALRRPALLALPLLLLACGGGDNKPPLKDPPQAFLTVSQPNTAGQKLTVQVSATGCEQVHSLSIYDRDDFLKAVTYSGGTVSVDLASNELKYTRGIAAHLSLKARVVCTDGRQNDSQPQPATFFPVAEFIEAPANTQLVPDFFVTEGSGSNISFIGCGNLLGGLPRLFRVDKNGKVLKTADMPFLCTTATVVTPKHPTTRKRWVWTPDAGAIAVDEDLNISARISLPVDLLTVGPDGDAIIYDAGTGGSAKEVQRVSHETGGALRWRYSPRGFLITSPAARGDDVMIATVTSAGAPSGRANIVVARVDYGRQNPATGGVELGTAVMKEIASDNPIPTTAPPATFSEDGNVLYLSFQGLGGLTQVLACLTQSTGCEGTAQRWQKPATLTGHIVATVPYAAGSRLAAIAPQHVWLLDASTGAVLNKDQAPLSPEGALVVLRVQSGGGSYPHAFYLLNGPAPRENLPAPMPLEIVATDEAAKGELFRYQINSGSLSAAVDETGTLWLRVGPHLVRPLTPPEYRERRP